MSILTQQMRKINSSAMTENRKRESSVWTSERTRWGILQNPAATGSQAGKPNPWTPAGMTPRCLATPPRSFALRVQVTLLSPPYDSSTFRMISYLQKL